MNFWLISVVANYKSAGLIQNTQIKPNQFCIRCARSISING